MIGTPGLSYHLIYQMLLEACSSIAQSCIYVANNTQKQNTCHTDHQAETHGATILEGWDRLLVRRNEHGLDNQQVVIQGDDGVDQCDEHDEVVSAIEGCCKYEELAEEACEWRNTCQREQSQGHDHGEFRVGLV